MDCVFCKIASGGIPADIVYSDDDVVAFRDIHPLAPVHVVIIPRKHIPSVNDLAESDQWLAGKIIMISKKLAQTEGIAQSGYRLTINSGKDGTQEVPHIHLHLIGGRQLSSGLG